jgi:taurine dioxygenase
MDIQINPSEKYALGCRIEGIDIARGIDDETYARIEDALHKHLVVCVSGRRYGHDSLVAFGRHFGTLTVNKSKNFYHDGKMTEVKVLSNEVQEGKPKGSPDAGQIWHTDMSYNRIAGRATVLHAHKVPMRAGKSLGDTAFRDMHAAYEALPDSIKHKLKSAEAVHDLERLWDLMRQRDSPRPPYTDEQRREKPPVVHPVFLRHPWTNRLALYVNRAMTQRILGLSPGESDETLRELFDFQEEPTFEFRHEWRVGDTLIWDNCATLHLATGGYDASTPRVMIRVQAEGDEVLYRRANGDLGGRIMAVEES